MLAAGFRYNEDRKACQAKDAYFSRKEEEGMQEEENYVTGRVLAIFFTSPDNYYKVLKIKIKDQDMLYDEGDIVVVGHFGRVQEGEDYTFYGHLTSHPKYGLQFAANRYEDQKPSSEEALISYLSSSKFKGVGPKTAQNIVDELGINAIDLILDDPSYLDQVTNLKQDKKDLIAKNVQAERGVQKVILKLNEYGISNELAYRIYAEYEEKTLAIIQSNPYQLIYDIKNIGFNKADTIAYEIGIKPDSKERLYAGVVHSLTEDSLNQGNTYLEGETMVGATIRTLEKSQDYIIDPDDLADRIGEMVEARMIIEDQDHYYLPSLYASEWGIVTAIERIKSQSSQALSKDYLSDCLAEVEADNDLTYDKGQREAILEAIQSPFFILTGGPGTGKTTVLKGLIQLFAQVHDLSLDPADYTNQAFPILMAAPTGRAAKRMGETTGLPASTIHRLLGLTADQDQADLDTQLEGQLLIIDEMSMVDTWLAYQLFKAVPNQMQVVLVGDKDQLPSVGPGQVFKDLIDSQVIDMIELTEIYRQADQSSIVSLAHHIKNEVLPADFASKQADRSFLPAESSQVAQVIEQVVTNAIAKGFTAEDIQVLAPMYKGQAGIDRLNKLVQELINPPGPGKKEVQFIDTVFRINDKVLHQVNDPDRNVFNGDIGKITGIIPSKESQVNSDELVIDFDGNEVTYMRNEWNKIALSYCSSIHKSQGSEYKIVILPLTFDYWRMLRKDLLYTAVTRASDFLILCGQKAAFNKCLTTGVNLRQTSLKDRLLTGQTNFQFSSGEDLSQESKTETEVKGLQPADQKDHVLTPDLVDSEAISPMIGMEGISLYDF